MSLLIAPSVPNMLLFIYLRTMNDMDTLQVHLDSGFEDTGREYQLSMQQSTVFVNAVRDARLVLAAWASPCHACSSWRRWSLFYTSNFQFMVLRPSASVLKS